MVTGTAKTEFKQTDIGVIPKDWDLISFEKAFNFLTTASYSRSEISEEGEVNYIHYGDIHTKWDFFIDIETCDLPKISLEKGKKYPFLKEGDLVIVDASEDYEGICKSVEIKNLGNTKVISGLHTFLLRPKEDLFVNGYKAYINSSKYLKNQFDKYATGLKVYGVSKGNLKQILIPYPKNTEEQERIVCVLSDTDNLINSLNKTIKKKKNIKQGTMQFLLTGKKRLRGFEKKWNVKKVESFTDVVSGGTPSTLNSDYWNGSIRWMNSGELNNKKIFDVDGRITQEGLENSSTQLVPAECILIGLAGQGKTRGTVAINYVELCTNQSIAAILPNEYFNSEFLYHYLDSKYDDLRNLSTGDGGRGGLNLTILRNLEMNIPSDIKEQEAIATVLNLMDEEIEALEKERNKYINIKKGMMQQLLTGSIRLK